MYNFPVRHRRRLVRRPRTFADLPRLPDTLKIIINRKFKKPSVENAKNHSSSCHRGRGGVVETIYIHFVRSTLDEVKYLVFEECRQLKFYFFLKVFTDFACIARKQITEYFVLLLNADIDLCSL